MGDRHPPQRGSRGIKRGQLPQFLLRDPQSGQRLRSIGRAIAIGIQTREVVEDAGDLHHPAIGGGNP